MLKLIFRLFLDSSHYKRELRSAEQASKNMASRVGNIFKGTLGKLFGIGLGGGAIAAGIALLTRKIFAQADALTKLRREFGLTVDEAAKLQEIANRYNADPGDMVKVIKGQGDLKETLGKEKPGRFDLNETDVTRLSMAWSATKRLGTQAVNVLGKGVSWALGKAAKIGGVTEEKEAAIVAKMNQRSAQIAEVSKKEEAETLGSTLRDKSSVSMSGNPRATVGAFVGSNPIMESVALERQMLQQLRAIHRSIQTGPIRATDFGNVQDILKNLRF